VRLVAGIVAVFQAPLWGLAIVAWASRVPGVLLPVSGYRPRTARVAVDEPSWYTARRVTVPLEPAVYWKASAIPALLLSRLPSIVVLPSSAAGAVAGVAVGIAVLVEVADGAVGDDVAEGSGVAESAGTTVAVRVGVREGAGVLVAVAPGTGVAVRVTVGVGLADAWDTRT
jgi:hypothetical protein